MTTAKTKQEWSKRELGAFYKVVITHGVPWIRETNDHDYTFVQEKVFFGFVIIITITTIITISIILMFQASLTQKTPEMIKQYYIQFLQHCKEIQELKNEGKILEMKEKETAANLTFVQVIIVLQLTKSFIHLQSHYFSQIL